MHNLVGVAAQNELPGLAQRLENQAELDRGQILHFIGHHEVVGRPAGGKQIEADAIQVIAPGRLQKRQKRHLLGRILIVMCVIKRTRVVDQKGGVCHVQHLAGELAKFLECQDGLAAAVRADQDERRALPQGAFLQIVERQNLVEHMDPGHGRVHIIQRPDVVRLGRREWGHPP